MSSSGKGMSSMAVSGLSGLSSLSSGSGMSSSNSGVKASHIIAGRRRTRIFHVKMVVHAISGWWRGWPHAILHVSVCASVVEYSPFGALAMESVLNQPNHSEWIHRATPCYEPPRP
jgi:hypothetical protein